MFILSLRGRFGTSITLLLHGLSLLVTVVLFVSAPVGLRFCVLLVFVVGSVGVLRHMNANKERLQFNRPENRLIAYPNSAKLQNMTAYFQGFICVIFFVSLGFLRLTDVDLADTPKGLFAVVFYAGCLAFIGILQNVVHRLP